MIHLWRLIFGGGRVEEPKRAVTSGTRSTAPPTAARTTSNRDPAAAGSPEPTKRGDRARLESEAEPFSRELKQWVREHGFQRRMDEVRDGRAGLRPIERGWVQRQLETLDRAQLKELRAALVETPPHPRLREMRKHPAILGPPTAGAIASILAGEPLGLARGAADTGELEHRAEIAGSPGDLPRAADTGELEHRAEIAGLPGDLPRTADLSSRTDLSGVVFAEGQSVIIRRRDGTQSGWRIAAYLPEHGVVLVQRGAAIRSVRPEVLLHDNPPLIPVGVSLPAVDSAQGGTGPWIVSRHGEDGWTRLIDPSGQERWVTAGDLGRSHHALLFGPAFTAGESAAPAGAHSDAGVLSASDVEATRKEIIARFDAVMSAVAGHYRAIEGKGEAARMSAFDWAAESGSILNAIRTIDGPLAHYAYGAAIPMKKEIAEAFSAIDRDIAAWRKHIPQEARIAIGASNAPNWNTSTTNTRASAPSERVTRTDPARPSRTASPPPPDAAKAALEAALKPAISALESKLGPEIGGLVPFFHADPTLIEAPSGKLPTLEEATEVARAAYRETRTANDYAPTGCYARAHLTAERLLAKGLAAAKIFVQPTESSRMHSNVLKPDLPFPKGQEPLWSYHVAAATFVQDPSSGEKRILVIDPSFSDRPLEPAEWASHFLTEYNVFCNFDLASPYTYEPGAKPAPGLQSRMIAEAWCKCAELTAIARGTGGDA